MKTLMVILVACVALLAKAEFDGCFFEVENVTTNTTVWGATTNTTTVAGRVRQVDLWASTNMTVRMVTLTGFGTGWGGVRTAMVERALSPGVNRVTNSYDWPLFGDLLVLEHKSASVTNNTLYVTLTLEK